MIGIKMKKLQNLKLILIGVFILFFTMMIALTINALIEGGIGWNIKFNLNKDLISGYGALLGSVLSFLSVIAVFYVLIEEKIERKNDDIEKHKIIHKENIDRLKFTNALLKSNYDFLCGSGENLIEFIEKEKNNPLLPNRFSFLINSGYEKIQEMDLLKIYQSLQYIFRNETNSEWETEFVSILKYLEFYNANIVELRERYQNHIAKKSELINNIISPMLEKVLNDFIPFIERDFVNFLDEEFRFFEEFKRTDRESNMLELREKFLAPIIEKLLKLRNSIGSEYVNIKNKLEFFLGEFSSINKLLGNELRQVEYYTEELERIHNKYYSENNENLKKIDAFISLLNNKLKLVDRIE